MSKTILIVEDEASLRNALRDKFLTEGFEVIESKNGEEGLKSALQNHPDLILLDIIMPVMGGLEMLGELRKDEWGKSAHVILLTNLSDNEDIAKAMENNTFEYFVKSDIKIEEVVKKVKEILKI